MDSTWTNAVQLGMLIGGSGAIGAFISGLFGRRRVRADASAILSEASSHMVEEMRTDLDDAKEKLRVFQRALWEHQKWDAKVVSELEKHDVSVPPPPELWL